MTRMRRRIVQSIVRLFLDYFTRV